MFFNKTTHVFKDILDLNLISSVIVHCALLQSKQRRGDGSNDSGEICECHTHNKDIHTLYCDLINMTIKDIVRSVRLLLYS